MRFTRRTLLHSRSARFFFLAWIYILQLDFSCRIILLTDVLFYFFSPVLVNSTFSLFLCISSLFALRSALRLHLWKAESFLSLFSPLRLEFINTLARATAAALRRVFFLLFFPLRFQFHSYTCLTTPRQSGDIYSLFSRVSSFHSCVYSMLYYGVHFTFVLY